MKEYFSHDFGARNDPKLIKVLMKLGQEGKGVYWDLIEMMYEQNGYLMRSECDSYAFALRTSCDLMQSLINDFGLFSVDGELFYSKTVHKRLNLRSEKSKKAAESAHKRWNNANAMRTHSEGNAIKEKKSKLNKRKEEIVISDFDFDFVWNDYDKKTGDKEKIKKKWIGLKPEEREAIFKHIPLYKESQPDKAYRKNFETYLNNKSWNDEIIKKQAPGANFQAPVKVGKAEQILEDSARSREAILLKHGINEQSTY